MSKRDQFNFRIKHATLKKYSDLAIKLKITLSKVIKNLLSSWYESHSD